MKYKFRILRLLSFYFVILLFCSLSKAESGWPKEIVDVIRDWQGITSIYFDETGGKVSGTVVKRWKLEKSDNVSILKEVLPLTQVIKLNNPSEPKQGGVIEWTSSEIKFSNPLTFSNFRFDAGNAATEFYILDQTTKDKIVISFTNKNYKLILTPTRQTEDSAKFTVKDHQVTGMSQTPQYGRLIGNAYLEKIYGFSTKEFPDNRYYLNHPVKNRKRQVILSQEFPDDYLYVLRKTLTEWNTLLGTEYYILGKKMKLNTVDCLSEDLLCLQWIGGTRFTWTSFHGVTEIAADPGNGSVLGGIIYIYNDADLKTAREGTAEELEAIENLSSLSKIMMSFSKITEYSKIWRPNSDELVKYLLLHEMGHFFGWDHNFAGSWSGTVDFPGDTIMGYAPFVLAGKLNHLGKIDVENYHSIYDLNSKNKLGPYCGDLDIYPKEFKGAWIKEIPECYMYTVGDVTNWLILSATLYGNWSPIYGWGIYSVLTPQKQELATYIAGLGFILKNSASVESQNKARNYLCRNNQFEPKIAEFLKENLKLNLVCEN